MSVAWAKPATDERTLGPLLTPDSSRLVLGFDPVDGGAVLQVIGGTP